MLASQEYTSDSELLVVADIMLELSKEVKHPTKLLPFTRNRQSMRMHMLQVAWSCAQVAVIAVALKNAQVGKVCVDR